MPTPTASGPTCFDDPDHLVAHHQRIGDASIGKAHFAPAAEIVAAVAQMGIGVAHPALGHSQQHLRPLGRGVGSSSSVTVELFSATTNARTLTPVFGKPGVWSYTNSDRRHRARGVPLWNTRALAWCRSRSRMLTAVVCSGRKRPHCSKGQCEADGQGAAFVGGGDEPEQQLGAGVVERGEAEFVEDDRGRRAAGCR